MKLHVSFDMADLAKAHSIAQQIAEHITTVHIGSLLLYSHGIEAIKSFKASFPHLEIIVDSKIIDRAKEATSIIMGAGADWTTVMAGAPKEIIHSACAAAHNENKNIFIDLLDSCSLGQSALEAQSMGGDALIFHGPYSNSSDPILIDNWNMVRNNTTLPIFIATSRSILDTALNLNPDGVIVSKLITESENPLLTVQELLTKITSS
jgi:3-keto-L-gulonate-6-phosphate decarboxylase